jgi:hypothetical protein
MEAIGYFQRPNEAYVIVHCCFECGLERFNCTAADDTFELVLSLPVLPARTSREMKEQQLEEMPGNESEMRQRASRLLRSRASQHENEVALKLCLLP